ncbi:MAG: hypothetical protein KF824_04535 [Fimbriimonadaceae bacterium]|nr:MAG: hypothetical protein KF824_04535 [Fimbriimonadaceae bacterium]
MIATIALSCLVAQSADFQPDIGAILEKIPAFRDDLSDCQSLIDGANMLITFGPIASKKSLFEYLSMQSNHELYGSTLTTEPPAGFPKDKWCRIGILVSLLFENPPLLMTIYPKLVPAAVFCDGIVLRIGTAFDTETTPKELSERLNNLNWSTMRRTKLERAVSPSKADVVKVYNRFFGQLKLEYSPDFFDLFYKQNKLRPSEFLLKN